MDNPVSLELLAPARDVSVGRIAILAGADAVYIGGPAFGARSAATNSIEDIASLVAFAHQYRVRVYVTMNTILYDNEIEHARDIVWQLYTAGVDALIIQDMSYLMMDLLPIALHASTQCNISTPVKAQWLGKAGFSQIVLPREFTFDEIKAAREAAGVPVEVFVHGALCVSYSGDCQAGQVAMRRSANRGECPQMCRLPYTIVDSYGNEVAPERHYLSLRDLCHIDRLARLIEAGATSFKIEGRLKDSRYVANVTAAYSQRLDSIVSRSEGRYRRSSVGKSVCSFTPDPSASFNRGFTSYFASRPGQMASLDTPKWSGQPVGTVSATPRDKRYFTATLTQTLSNGDGLGFFDNKRHFVGFRLNRVEGDRLYPATMPNGLRTGMQLYRNADKAFFDLLDATDAGCRRTINVRFGLRPVDDAHFALTADCERGCHVTLIVDCPLEASDSPQTEKRAAILSKLGGTVYRCDVIEDSLGDVFIPASILTSARRRVIELLDANASDTYSYDKRRPDTLPQDAFVSMPPLDYHDNVANALAAEFYTSHGAQIRQKAIEICLPSGNEIQVMRTRYCIRRELDACLRDRGKRDKLPSPCFLKNDSGLYRLDFDCARCGMNVVKVK